MAPHHRPLRHRPPRAAQHGVALLEVLVAILIFSFGVLGVAGLQASMTKAQTSSKLRGEAAYLAQELFGTMWADRANLALYASTASCTAHPPCSAIQSKVAARLPAGTVAFTNELGGRVGLQISWTPPGEDTHRYATVTTIQY